MIIDRSKRPTSSQEIKFNTPGIHHFDLNNGLKIFFSAKKDLPIVRINFIVNNGSKFDPDDKKGLCNLLAMCIDEGAGEFDALQLADEFEQLGAQFSVSCDTDVSIISLQVLSENFISALNLLSAVITQPHFNDDDFELQKNKVLVRLNQSKAEPDYIADISFEYFLFGNNSPYAFPVMGVEHTVQNIDADSIRNVYKNYFAPMNSTMVVVGDIDNDLLKKELELVLGKWDHKPKINSSVTDFNRTKRKIFIINKPGAVQTEIRTGHLSSKRNEKDFFQKQVVNMILGGQFSSRLNLNLREKNGYTYGVHSHFSYFKEAGYFAVSTSVDLNNTANALNEIYKEIEKIRNGISNDELSFTKSSLTKKYPSNFETYRQIAANISSKVIHNLPNDYFETYINKINSLSLDDVNKIAYNSIYPDELITVLVGDSKSIFSQLSENDFGEITTLEFEEVFQK
ncbi:MAG: insulinase family protein [Ignavibacteriaceae bacterium]|nr:insulinase family protein [Ignavibacteriaceae bacterium]